MSGHEDLLRRMHLNFALYLQPEAESRKRQVADETEELDEETAKRLKALQK